MAEQPATKKQRTENGISASDSKYTLLYHAGVPGRGEPIRLVLEATGTPYTDTAKSKDTAGQVYALLGDDATTSPHLGSADVQPFAPPVLRVHDADDQGDLLISQTTNILSYLGTQLGLAGISERQKYQIHQLALTASDLLNEAHDTHHPVAVADYYEDQKDEALRRSKDFRENRVPKFLGYFERVLGAGKARGEEEEGGGGGVGRYLVGARLSYADLMLWQVIDGIKFAFPKELQARQEAGEFPLLLGTFYPGIQEHDKLKQYLASDRRASYSQGIFRHYPELDRQ